jgi:hypothetical protein
LALVRIPNSMTEKVFEEPETLPSDINDDNLLLKIWLKPKDTLTHILKNYPDKYVTILLVLGGVVRAIDRASNKSMGDNMSTVAVLGVAIIFGGLFGWMTYYIYAWAMSVTGQWIKGESNSSQFRTIIAWALIPSICSLVLLGPELIVFGDDLFKSEPVNDSSLDGISWIIFGVIELTLGIWTMIILVKGISLIQNFSIGKSILNMILPGLLILIPILAIVLLVGMFD